MKIKRNAITCSACCLALFLLAGCDHPALFNLNSSDLEKDEAAEPDYTFEVEQTGGIAGVYQRLTISGEGVAEFKTERIGGSSYTHYLEPDELAALHAVFRDQDFMGLEKEYASSQGADLFYFKVSYAPDGRSHTVFTDYISAPAALQEIIDVVGAQITAVQKSGVALSLELAKDEITSGDEVTFTLKIKNMAATPRILHFSDGQLFDFVVSPQDDVDYDEWTILNPKWRWAADKAFIQVLTELTLSPGEEKEYSVQWAGSDSSGRALTGRVYVSASLLAVPGGRTPFKILKISQKPTG